MINDCSIQARLFFKILNDNDYSLLGEGTEEEQKEAFAKIDDEYFLLIDDTKQKSILRKDSRIKQAKFQINYLEKWGDIYLNTPLNLQHRTDLCDSLKDALDVVINPEYTKEQVEKKLKKEINRRESKLIIEEAELKTIVKKNSDRKFNFYDDLVILEKAINKDNIPEDVSLYKYISYRKQIKKKK